MDEEKEAYIDSVKTSFGRHLIKGNVLRISKNTELSENFRKLGNECFVRPSHNNCAHESAWAHYSFSIAVAEEGSEFRTQSSRLW